MCQPLNSMKKTQPFCAYMPNMRNIFQFHKLKIFFRLICPFRTAGKHIENFYYKVFNIVRHHFESMTSSSMMNDVTEPVFCQNSRVLLFELNGAMFPYLIKSLFSRENALQTLMTLFLIVSSRRSKIAAAVSLPNF